MSSSLDNDSARMLPMSIVSSEQVSDSRMSALMRHRGVVFSCGVIATMVVVVVISYYYIPKEGSDSGTIISGQVYLVRS